MAGIANTEDNFIVLLNVATDTKDKMTLRQHAVISLGRVAYSLLAMLDLQPH